jgi:leucyl aminopeptidase (aminopeptidase T)
MTDKSQKAIENIFKVNLEIKKTDQILIFTDGFNSGIEKTGKRIYNAGKKYTNHVQYIKSSPTECHGTEPPEDLWEAAFGSHTVNELKKYKLLQPLLLKKIGEKKLKDVENIIKSNKKDAVTAVIALSYYSTSHTRFRDMLNRICGTRYASMPLFDEKMLSGAMTVDWKNMHDRTKDMARIVNRYERVDIDCPNGTAISFSIQGRQALADTGIITKPGQFSNLPAGEVYLAPLEGTAHGQLVLDWAPTRKLKSPVTAYVEKGMVWKLEGKEQYVKVLEDKLNEKKENRNIAELGIGTNDKAKRPDNILESEKILGTIHIAFGDNSSFGGKVSTSFHQDYVFFDPTVTLISKKANKRVLLQKGRLHLK